MRRWLLAAIGLAAIGWAAATQIQAETVNAHSRGNQWDAVMGVFNNPIVIALLLAPGLVGLVGDVCLADRRSNYAMLTLSRAKSRTAWWLSKMQASLIAGLLYGLVAAAVISVVGGVVMGFGWRVSAFAANSGVSSASFGTYQAPAPPFAGVPVLGVAAVGAYFGVASASFALPMLALSQAFPKPWVPLALTFATCFVFFRVPVFTVMHPLIHLFWTFHDAGNASYVVTWWASIAYLAMEIATAALVGRAILARADL